MFTGIIEALGTIREIQANGGNIHFWVESPFADELKIDQSLSHDGVCLTIDALNTPLHRVTAVRETLEKTSLGEWRVGQTVNLERAMILGARLDGHLVQGHVDSTGICNEIIDQDGSWKYTFEFEEKFSRLVIEKGSICVNGISLTAFDVTSNHFSVAIIPYTYNHTNINQLQKNSKVNLEFDIVGKYVTK
ncbi:MAG: riboflavin synthase [bacterium]